MLDILIRKGFPDSSVGKESACDPGDLGSIPGSGRSPGEGIGYPLQYSWTEMSFYYKCHSLHYNNSHTNVCIFDLWQVGKGFCKYAHVLTPRICQTDEIILEYPGKLWKSLKSRRGGKNESENEAEEKAKVDKHKESP